ncbi:hypothetical protein QO206_13225 [Leeuwenhoekiella aequorea]|uniref:hypothetical protein n=1 Tax=Leeuwenhoekiella aequorea TaxID=283736 RepID=UPI00352F062B|tara:strand:+ start:10762 stop:11286 length:525 start_codon:yes stop_codon:yes gene_type:complete
MKAIEKLNYNDLSFFAGIDTIDAKWFIWEKLNLKDKTEKGYPKVNLTDEIKVSDYNFSIRSNSNLDGKSQFEYLFKYYSTITDKQKLRFFAESKVFTKALCFTGSHSILNKILERSAYRKLQERWLLDNCFCKKVYSKKTIAFIIKNEWAENYLLSNGVRIEDIDRNCKELKAA